MKPREYSVAQARDRLASLVHEAERGRAIHITRRGRPVAVLISEAEFQRVRGRATRGVGDAILQWRAKHGGVDLRDEEIAAWRDRSSGELPDLGGAER